jgi:hypothetical protein
MAGLGVATIRAVTPVDDLGFIDGESMLVRGAEARSLTHGTIDVDGATTRTTNEMVVVVVGAVLVASRRSCRLDTSDQALVGEYPECVVYRLSRNCPYLGPYDLLDVFRSAVRSAGYRPHHRQSLRRDLDLVLSQELDWITANARGGCVAHLILDCIQNRIDPAKRS